MDNSDDSKLLYNYHDIAKIFVCITCTLLKGLKEIVSMHVFRQHMSECVCSDCTSMFDELPDSIALLWTAWMPDTRFDRDYYGAKMNSDIILNYDGVPGVLNDWNITG